MMASRFNFKDVEKKMRSEVVPGFLNDGINLAKLEFAKNFESESNSESNEKWSELSPNYYGRDPEDAPILDLTGKLKDEALNNRPVISGNKAILTIDPIDSRGKGYASYHEDGENQYRDKVEFQREFVTQSKELDEKQKRMLINKLDKAFK